MSTIEIILSLAWVPWMVLCFVLERKIKRLERKLKNQPIGRVVKAELTEDGLMMTSQIFDDDVWAKLAGDVEGMSIGYKPKYSVGVDHATLYTLPDGKEVDLSFKEGDGYTKNFRLHSISLDEEPNAWGYTTHLADCPAYPSKDLPAIGCTCTPIPTVDGSPPTTPDYKEKED